MTHPRDEIVAPITEAISDALERPIEEIPPIRNSINLDALDAVVKENQSADVKVLFSHAGLRILVLSEGTVYVRPIQHDSAGSSESVYFDER